MIEPINILIVEDEDDHYELIQRSFEDKQDRYRLHRATNIRQARQGNPAFTPSLIITDWKLPDGDGIELIEKDVSGFCRCPVIVMTSHGNEAWAVEAMKLGALDYFVKSPQAFTEVPHLAQRAFNEWTNTSERRKAEEALRRSEDLFRALFENASDGILHLAANGKIVSLNASFARMHGYTVDEMLKMGISELALPASAQLEPARLQRVLAGEPLIFEVEHHCKNGQTIPLEVSANAITVSGERYILGFYRDISERKRTEKKVHEEEARLATLFRISQFEAKTVQEFLDYALNEVIELTGSKIGYIYHYHDDTREFILNSWSKEVMHECAIAESQTVYQLDKTGLWGEVVRQRKPIIVNDFQGKNPLKKGYPSGHVELFKFLTVPVFAGERIVAVSAVANRERDYDEADVQQLSQVMNSIWQIVERMRAEAELSKSRQDWEDIFQAIGQPAMILSLDHDILAVNEATVRVIGKKASELIARKCYEVFHADQGSMPPSCCPLVSMQQSRQTHVEEMEVNAMGGRFLVSCTPVFDQTGKVTKVIHIAVDITEKQKLQEKLNQAQKMEAIGTLAGGIAHDFNNILAAIIGYTDLALLRTKEHAVQDDLRQVRKAGERATDLVRQILTFSRKQPQEKTPIQISMVIKDALKLLRASIPSTIEIRQEIISEATVLADPTQVHQIVMNLCTNAYHAMMDGGGVLGVTLKEINLAQSIIDFDTELAPGRYVELAISDSGCGMDKETMVKIFDPYFTTKGTGKGTGLGLAVVHGIVKSHNGRIAVYSEPGRGTTFNVYLPMVVHEPELEAVELAPPMARAHERVMVVDDERTIRDLTSQFLVQAGYRVDTFTNGMEAWRALSQAPNDWDILVTDQTMPELTGDQLALKVLALRPDLPIILCSGYSTIMNRDTAKEARVFAYLQKPVGRNKLLSEVFQALAKQP